MSALQEINRYMAGIGDVSARTPVLIRCSPQAHVAIRVAHPRRKSDPHRLPGVPELSGVPIQIDDRLPAGYWQTLDQFGHMISDGMVRQ